MKHAAFLVVTKKGKMVQVELKLLPEPVKSWPCNFARLPGVVVDTCGDAEKDAWSAIQEVVNLMTPQEAVDVMTIPTIAVDDGKAEKEPRKERPWAWDLDHAEANVNDLLLVLMSNDVALSNETEEDILHGVLKHIRNARTEFALYPDRQRVGGEGR